MATALSALQLELPGNIQRAGPECVPACVSDICLLRRTIAPSSTATIAMSAGVDADAQRIFQALTLPEYLEAWLALPGAAPGEVIASPEENGYRLHQCIAGRKALRITGAFLFCHQRKMRLVWHKEDDARQNRSVLDFRIRGNFGSSVLELRHMELDSTQEIVWHRELWQASLRRLTSLLRTA
jgi:Activator of Hsp90 ATPase homolog 1-like protein